VWAAALFQLRFAVGRSDRLADDRRGSAALVPVFAVRVVDLIGEPRRDADL